MPGAGAEKSAAGGLLVRGALVGVTLMAATSRSAAAYGIEGAAGASARRLPIVRPAEDMLVFVPISAGASAPVAIRAVGRDERPVAAPPSPVVRGQVRFLAGVVIASAATSPAAEAVAFGPPEPETAYLASVRLMSPGLPIPPAAAPGPEPAAPSAVEVACDTPGEGAARCDPSHASDAVAEGSGGTSPPAPPAGPVLATEGGIGMPTAAGATELTASEAELYRLINETRAAAGLSPLRLDSRLVAAAREHSHDMAARGSCRHVGGDGTRARDRMERAGYPANNWAGENIKCSTGTPAAALCWWMGSLPHRKNILHAHFTDIGVGMDPGGPYGAMWTLNFAAGAGP